MELIEAVKDLKRKHLAQMQVLDQVKGENRHAVIRVPLKFLEELAAAAGGSRYQEFYRQVVPGSAPSKRQVQEYVVNLFLGMVSDGRIDVADVRKKTVEDILEEMTRMVAPYLKQQEEAIAQPYSPQAEHAEERRIIEAMREARKREDARRKRPSSKSQGEWSVS